MRKKEHDDKDENDDPCANCENHEHDNDYEHM